MVELQRSKKAEEMQGNWQGLIKTYIRGCDYEQVPGVCHHVMHNGYWKTVGGETINRLDRWGDEWLMGIAYGLAWLVQSGPLDGVSPEWHMHDSTQYAECPPRLC